MGMQSDPNHQADFARRHGLTMEDLCERLFVQHGAHIRVKKACTATPNLARILEAALKLGNRCGYHSMSMRDLAAESGLSLGALYSYIRDKDTLLQMMLDVVTEAIGRVLDEPPNTLDGDPRERLRWIITQHIWLTEVMQPWFAFAYMEAKAFGPSARQRARTAELQTEGLIAAALEAGVKTGVFRPLEPRTVAALIKPLLQDWYLKRWKYRRRGLGPAAYADAVIDFVERGILAEPPCG